MLICDKRRPRTRGDTNIRPPQGGRIKTAPRPPARAYGAPWRGAARPPAPLGCAPWRAFAHRAPAASVIQSEGFRARVRPVARVGNAQRCPPSTPSPWRFSGFRRNSKGGPCGCTAGGFGGRAPRCRAAVGNPAQAVGGQGAAAGCARRPRTGRGCPRATGPQGRALDH